MYKLMIKDRPKGKLCFTGIRIGGTADRAAAYADGYQAALRGLSYPHRIVVHDERGEFVYAAR